jgi:hypothetical protein
MTDALPTKYTKLLLEFKSLPRIEKKRTFMEIAGYTYYENMCSNILQFFLEPSNEHGLKDLMLISLIRTVEPNFPLSTYFGEVKITREHVTKAQNRLDLLIQTEDYIIGIENKIFHHLHNDLSDYKDLVDSYCGSSKRAIYLVLSLNKLTKPEDTKKVEENEFINITYDDIFKNIREVIGRYLNSSNTIYTNYLIDFMKTIENLNPKTMENKEAWTFFKNYTQDINHLAESFDQYKKYLYGKLGKLKEQMTFEEFMGIDEPKIYEKEVRCLYYNIKINSYVITVDACIDINGWEIWLSAIKESEGFLFKEMLSDRDFSFLSNNKPVEIYYRNRLVLKHLEIDIEDKDIPLIVDELKGILTKIDNYKNRIENNTAHQIANG